MGGDEGRDMAEKDGRGGMGGRAGRAGRAGSGGTEEEEEDEDDDEDEEDKEEESAATDDPGTTRDGCGAIPYLSESAPHDL